MLLGALAVLCFSGTFPATTFAVADLDPSFVALARGAVAAALAAMFLLMRRAAVPSRSQLASLSVVAGGVVMGFPLLTSLALTSSSTAHAAIVAAFLPGLTSVLGSWRSKERQPAAYWTAACLGAVSVAAFMVVEQDDAKAFAPSDAYLIVAVVVCALGYCEGGVLAREMGGPLVISWAIVLSAPITVLGTAVLVVLHPPSAGAAAWLSMAYLSAFSAFLGFFAWYAALSRSGIARASQLQLSQPLMTVLWAWLFLGDRLDHEHVTAAAAVLVCVAGTQYFARPRSLPVYAPDISMRHDQSDGGGDT